MAVTKRLTSTVPGGGSDVPIGPSNYFGSDSAIDFGTLVRDLRLNRIQVLTLFGFGTGDSFKLIAYVGGLRKESMTFNHGSTTAGAIQTELRSLTGDSGLTVTGTQDVGPFTITHTLGAWPRAYPRYEFVGTGCTGTVDVDFDLAWNDASIQGLGESHRVSETNTILPPTITDVTVNPATKVATITYTENGGGDAVLVAVVDTTTFKTYGLTVDDTSPVDIGPLPVGDYMAVLRTVEANRLSKAATSEFSVT